MLEQADLDQSVPKEEYKHRLPQLQQRLYDLEHTLFTANIPTLLVFEGWAAAGKGGAINILTERLDPRGFRVVPVTPPRTYETRYPWMWRFWQKIPANGQIAIFDQSWYRRVLIERVNKLIPKREWQAAFQDIAEFEEMLAADGAVIVKFWLHISKKEQARRFKKLLKDRLTAWQVTDEDAAQHANYNRYVKAVEEMLMRTDAPHAPWVIVPATDRYSARLTLLETIIRTLEHRLSNQAPLPQSRPATAKEAVHA
jgi:polyphosphate kinase 2 (PPK2 family)